MDIINAYEQTGSMRTAAVLCGTTHKTVKRVLDRRAAGQRPGRRRAPQPGLAAPFTDLIYQKVKATDGRITAKRLLPIARADGYTGSARTLRRAVRPRTEAEKQFVALGQDAVAFLRAAAAAGTPRLASHLVEIVALRQAHGHDTLNAALRRAVQFRRFTADDLRSILAAGPAAPTPARAGAVLEVDLPAVPTRGLDAYRTDTLREVA